MSLAHDLQFAIDLARGAGKIVLDQYGKVRRLTKRHEEAVTDADRASQRFIVAGLRRRFPEDGIIGEENETGNAITFDVPDPDRRIWVIDPIDGTNNFIAGLGAFAVCIGLIERGMPVLGVVFDVTRDLVYSAAKGEGTWVGNQRLRALETPMSDSSMLMLTSNLLTSQGRLPGWVSRWIGQTNWKIRILGSAALEATQVAAGIAHGAVTVNGKLWDVAAPAALVLESGGILTDLSGNPVFPYNVRHYEGAKVPFLAAAPAAHAQLLAEIRQHP
ncbi:MAG TPA: inositol monophosphatase [Tepidisphaeraceae bacterium]|jgi:myo-inositol-1(or 4)-monophosphatase|nr:inositol monophosphatase [Tepidisphaeraceae bacterium]